MLVNQLILANFLLFFLQIRKIAVILIGDVIVLSYR